MMMSGEQSATPREPLPADILCPACGYDLSGARVERCSECEYVITTEVVERDERRRQYLLGRWRVDLLIGLSPIVLGTLVSIFAVLYPVTLWHSLLGSTYPVLKGFGIGVILVLPSAMAIYGFAWSWSQPDRKAVFSCLFGAQAVLMCPVYGVALSFFVSDVFDMYAMGRTGTALSVLALLVVPAIGIAASRLLWPMARNAAEHKAGLFLSEDKRKELRLVAFFALLPSILIVIAHYGLLAIVSIAVFAGWAPFP